MNNILEQAKLYEGGLFVSVLLITALTILVVFLINKKGEEGKIEINNTRTNGLIIAAGIIFLFPPLSFFITLPMLYIGRAQMRYSLEKGRSFSTFLLILCWTGFVMMGFLFLGMYSTYLIEQMRETALTPTATPVQ